MKPEERQSLVEEYRNKGGVAFLDLPEGTLAFKRPKQADYERFQDKLNRNKGESAAMRELVLCSMVWPKDKLQGGEILSAYPAVYNNIALKLQEMAGGDLEVQLKAE